MSRCRRVAAVFTRLWLVGRKGLRLLRVNGIRVTWRRLIRYIRRGRWRGLLFQADQAAVFQAWLKRHVPTDDDLARLRTEVQALPSPPRISVLMPVYNTSPQFLRAAIASVVGQVYPHWQLCIVDDGSDGNQVSSVLAELADPRISVMRLQTRSGISAASNTALALADGAYVAFLDHDDILPAHALARVAQCICEDPDVDLLYTDECCLEWDGRKVDPFFKPEYSPDLLLSMNYIGHLVVARTAMVREIGGLRSAFDGSQDYDLVLRLTEQTSHILHIADILYLWRRTPDSTSDTPEAKPYTDAAASQALEEAIHRRGGAAEVSILKPGRYRIHYAIQGSPLVSIVIPTRDHADLLRVCIDSIKERTDYRSCEIVVVDNGSSDRETLTYLDEIAPLAGILVLRDPAGFNWSRLNNKGAAAADGDYLLFLNNDIEIQDPTWLGEMLGHAQQPGVGAVGAKLLFPGGRIQHAGVIVGGGGGASHAFYEMSQGQPSYMDYADVVRNVGAVTGACLLTSRKLFHDLDGFDEDLPIAYNDVDYCLRLRAIGRRVVWTPWAVLMHCESMSRGLRQPEADLQEFSRKWGEALSQGDPYLNPHLDQDSLVYAIQMVTGRETSERGR